MNPALLQKGSNSFRTDSEIKDHEGRFPLEQGIGPTPCPPAPAPPGKLVSFED